MTAFRSRCLLLLALVLLGGASTLTASGAESTWIRYFEGPDYGALFDVTLMPDGSILAVGGTHYAQGDTSHGDILLMKLTLDGTPVWQETLGGEDLDQAIRVRPFGEDFLVLGETDSYGAGKRDLYLLRVSREGRILWSQTYGGPGVEWAKDLVVLDDEMAVLVGSTDSFEEGDFDAYLVAVDSEGRELWQRTYGDPTTQENASAAVSDGEGGLYLLSIISYPSGYPGSHRDSRIQHLDADGEEVWNTLLSGEYRMAGTAMVLSDDGGLLITGKSERIGSYPGPTDFWSARVDALTGEPEWSIQVGNPSFDDYGLALTMLPDGRFVSSGMGSGLPMMGFDNEDGSPWVRTLTDLRVHGGFSLLELPDGTFIIPGYVFCGHTNDAFDAVLVRVTADGIVE